MRLALLSLLGLVACDGGAAPIAWQSSLGVRTNGVVLHGRGDIGHAGLSQTNCPFETAHGMVTGDYDLPGEGEQVQDEGTSWLGDETVLAVLDGRVWLLEKSTGDYRVDDFELPGVGQARLSAGGIVGLRHTSGAMCEVVWQAGGSAPAPCANGFAVDVDTATAWVADPAGVWQVTPDATAVMTTGGDLVAFDAASGAVFVADRDGTTLTALEADGSVRWERTMDGAVRAVAASGAAQAAAVVLAHADGRGEIAIVDAWTGEDRGAMLTPEPATDVAVAPTGEMVALEAPNDVHFYRLRL